MNSTSAVQTSSRGRWPALLPALAAAACLALAACGDDDDEPAADASPQFTVSEIGPFGADTPNAVALSDAGLIAGMATRPDGTRYAYLLDGTTVSDLSAQVDGTFSPQAVNDAGRVVGQCLFNGVDDLEPGRACVVDRQSARDLAASVGLSSVARDINAAGVIVGTAGFLPETDDSLAEAFVLDAAGARTLGQLGGAYASAYAVDADGRAAGFAATSPGYGSTGTHLVAFLHDGMRLRALGTLGGNQSVALDIAAGRVTGWANDAAGRTRAMRHDGMTMADLGTPGNGASVGRGINAAGQVVGHYATPDGLATRAFLHDGARLHDLNDLLRPGSPPWPALTSAIAINTTGQVLAASEGAGPARYFLLTPVP